MAQWSAAIDTEEGIMPVKSLRKVLKIFKPDSTKGIQIKFVSLDFQGTDT